MKITLHNVSTIFYTCLLWFIFGFCPQNISAQIVLDTAVVSNDVKIIACPDGDQTFTDNGLVDGNYYDDAIRSDTIVICPDNNLHQVKVTFTSFDVATGDELRVYDCDLSKTTCAVKATAVGVGVSGAFGGWVQANCDRSVNATGCLSFVLKTNGDKVKGTGWTAKVSCESDKVTLECPVDVVATDDCNNLDGMVNVTIPKPTGKKCDGTTAMVTLSSTCPSLNALIGAAAVSADGGALGTFPLPLGTHIITAKSVSDTTITCTYRIIVDQPTIVCNDVLNISGGFYCPSRIGVDDIIENPCVGSGVSYEIEIDLGDNKEPVSAKVDGSNFATLNSGGVDFSALTFTCNQEFPVKITRIVKFNGCDGVVDSLTRTCESKIKISLTEQPEIIFPTQTITSCENGLTDEEIISQLNFDVSCGVFETKVTIESFPGNLCATDASAEIKIVATDVCGGKRTKKFDVLVVRPSRFFKPIDTIITCEINYLPENTGYPILDANNDGVGDNAIIGETCDYIANYTDETTISNGIRMVSRVWTIHDRCNLSLPVTLAPQLIQIKNSNPVFDCPNVEELGGKDNPIIVFANKEACKATINLTTPTATIGCGGSGAVTVKLNRATLVTDTSFKYTEIENIEFPIGAYFAEYIATDNDGGESICQLFFSIQQTEGLDVICQDELNITYVGNEIRVDIDNINILNDIKSCTAVSKAIKKEGGEWGTEVLLNCQEIADQIKVYLRVRDEGGNENTCWTTITGKDLTAPTCNDLADLRYACEEFDVEDFGMPTDVNNNNNFEEEEWDKLIGPLATIYNQAFGDPICEDNLVQCFQPLIQQQYQLIKGQCGGTKIKRRYRALDESGNLTDWYEQTVTLTIEPDFSVTFSADWSGECGANFSEPVVDIVTKGCNILAWESTDNRFDGVSEACYFIERTYTVTNWCLYEPGQETVVLSREEDETGFSSQGKKVTAADVGTIGRFSYIKVLKVMDNELPEITISEVETCLTNDNCTEDKTFTIEATDCSGDNLVYNYELKDSNGNIVANGDTKSFSTTVANQKYTLKWSVNDNCGNIAWKEVIYEFKDCKNPVPYCLGGIAIEIGESGTVAVWATDLTQNSSDNCTTADKLEYRVYHPTLGDSVTKPEENATAATVFGLPKNITFDCNYLGTQEVELYVIDEAGNWDYCIATVYIQDNLQGCNGGDPDPEGMAILTGKIQTTNGVNLEDVTIKAKDNELFQTTVLTDAAGNFDLSLPKGKTYNLSIIKEDELINGMTVFDIILVSKHILGISHFETPFQYIAADFNSSGSITAFDMVQMRQVVLNIPTSLQAADAWRFVDANMTFAEMNAAKEGYVNPLFIEANTDKVDFDITGVKLGDLNNSVKINGLLSADSRTNSPLILHLANQKIKKGDLVTTQINLAEIEKLQGIQFAIDFDGLTLQQIPKGILSEKNVVKQATRLSILWDKYNDEQSINNTLLELTFLAEKNGELSDFITLSNNFYAEAVDMDNQSSNIALQFEKLPTTGFELFQNTPNPFSEFTNISFQLDQPEQITLEVYNLQGTLVHQLSQYYTAGLHTVQLSKADLAAKGILVYQLKSGNGLSAKKMIFID